MVTSFQIQSAQKLSTNITPHEGVRAAFQHVHGGGMSSTTAQIKKTKEELQRLRSDYLKAADDETKKALELQINRRKRLLAELGAGHG